MGISAWKKPNMPAIKVCLPRLIFGSLSPFAMLTAQASIASPTPSARLVKTNSHIFFSVSRRCRTTFPSSSSRQSSAETSRAKIAKCAVTTAKAAFILHRNLWSFYTEKLSFAHRNVVKIVIRISFSMTKSPLSDYAANTKKRLTAEQSAQVLFFNVEPGQSPLCRPTTATQRTTPLRNTVIVPHRTAYDKCFKQQKIRTENLLFEMRPKS